MPEKRVTDASSLGGDEVDALKLQQLVGYRIKYQAQGDYKQSGSAADSTQERDEVENRSYEITHWQRADCSVLTMENTNQENTNQILYDRLKFINITANIAQPN